LRSSSLRRVAVGHHLLDDFLGAVEIAERRVQLDDLVGEDARQPGVVAGVDQGRLADRGEHPFRRRRVRQVVLLAQCQILGEGILFFAGTLVASCVVVKNGHVSVL
jgi:hypothetical protein